MIRIKGIPKEFDVVFRPMARIGLLTLGILGTIVITVFKLWWWLPLPLAASFLLYELIFWLRGDRPVRLNMKNELHFVDARSQRQVILRPDEIATATLYYQPNEEGVQVIAVLADRRSVRFAARFQLKGPFEAAPWDVDLKKIEGFLGGNAATVRAIAPLEVVCRQDLDDGKGQAIAWLRENIPESAWRRTAVRLWRGAAPSMDLFGLHEGDQDALLTLDGDRYIIWNGDKELEGEFAPIKLRLSRRPVILFQLVREKDTQPIRSLLLIGLVLDDGLTIAFPSMAPLKENREEVEATEDWLHTHLAEGAAFLWHLEQLGKTPQALRELRNDGL